MSTCMRALALVAALCGAVPAFAGPSKQCQGWFPDFAASCERQGRYQGFIPPMTMPYLFEEPFITTGLSGYGIWHEFPNESAFQGGDAWVAALQARIAITDRLALIATKDTTSSSPRAYASSCPPGRTGCTRATGTAPRFPRSPRRGASAAST